MPKYSTQKDPEKSARAYGYELHCSQKDSMNLAHALKGMTIEEARKYLEEVVALKRAVPALYHKKKRLHQRGIGPGSFPEKAARYMLKVLNTKALLQKP
jgi:large subunit ribosomal protein L22